eukprot:9012835-Lingulodinium_polyedra.AAC.1
MADFWQDAYERGDRPSPIWQIPGFIIRYCVPDFMHVSCLGIVQYLTGNVMRELFRELGGTRNQPTR